MDINRVSNRALKGNSIALPIPLCCPIVFDVYAWGSGNYGALCNISSYSKSNSCSNSSSSVATVIAAIATVIGMTVAKASARARPQQTIQSPDRQYKTPKY